MAFRVLADSRNGARAILFLAALVFAALPPSLHAATALEACSVDYNAYPGGRPGRDRATFICRVFGLATPVAYLTSVALLDLFLPKDWLRLHGYTPDPTWIPAYRYTSYGLFRGTMMAATTTTNASPLQREPSSQAQVLANRGCSLRLALKGQRLEAELSGPGAAVFAAGPCVFQGVMDGRRADGLVDAAVRVPDENTLQVTGRLGPLELEQRLAVLPDADAFTETIALRNPTDKPVKMSALRTGFSRRVTPQTDRYRLVAVPYRIQVDARLHDYSMKDLADLSRDRGRQVNSNNYGAFQIPGFLPCDEPLRLLRSEGWTLNDGERGLLIIKYNARDPEYAVANWDEETSRLIFGGAALTLYHEPARSQLIPPGQTFRFGETHYEFYAGGWAQAYALFKRFMNARGHGVPPDYNPAVHWNVLYDLGMNDDPQWKKQHWTRTQLWQEAALAREIGCDRLYLDPGWETTWGANLWDEARLGPLSDFISQLKREYGLDVALWSPGDFHQQWSADWRRAVPAAIQAPAVAVNTDRHRNLALLPAAKPAASSCLAGNPNHKIEHLNDGWYGNSASWIAGEMPAWAEIDLGAAYRISSVCLGNDHTQQYADRAATELRVLVAAGQSPPSNAKNWQAVAGLSGGELRAEKSFSFEPVSARWVRVEILKSSGGLPRLDEIEIYEASTLSDEAAAAAQVAARRAPSKGPVATAQVCMESEQYRAARLGRMLTLAQAGVKWFMFDFHAWTGPCYATNHGHPVPTTTADHIDSLYRTSAELRRRYPGVQTEMHCPIWPWSQRYLPTYFRQGIRSGDYDENWAFEFMWDTMEEFRTGRARSLYYYNLAYDLPLYLHIPIRADNDQCVAFWWFASTVRHLGIGGKSHNAQWTWDKAALDADKPFAAYKQAMASYNRLRPFFVRGEFHGINEDIHLHVLPEENAFLVNLFNLSDQPRTIGGSIALGRMGLDPKKRYHTTGNWGSVENGTFNVSLNLPPWSAEMGEFRAR